MYMTARNFFKKKEVEGNGRKTLVYKEHEAAPSGSQSVAISVPGYSYVLIQPVVSEKASRISEDRAYAFHVDKSANKTQIRKAIEALYQVKVIRVSTVNIPPKRIRVKRTQGWRSGYKKAIVTLREGQKIEIM